MQLIDELVVGVVGWNAASKIFDVTLRLRAAVKPKNR